MYVNELWGISMEMILFHGSEHIIETPIYGQGKKYNDYGLAFYCTEEQDLAKEWSVDDRRNGYCNAYRLITDELSMLDLMSMDYSVLHWLTILLENRTFDMQTDFAREAKKYLIDNFSIPYTEVDLIKGYRADDSYFSFAQDFLNNAISLSSLNRAMVLGYLGNQIAIKSKKAFDRIEYISAENVLYEEYYIKKMSRDSKARRDYFLMRNEPWKRGEIYMMQILEEEIKADDERIRRKPFT